jgi:hypothetical protein
MGQPLGHATNHTRIETMELGDDNPLNSKETVIEPSAEEMRIRKYLDRLSRCIPQKLNLFGARDNTPPEDTWVSPKGHDDEVINVTFNHSKRKPRHKGDKGLNPHPEDRTFSIPILSEKIALTLIWLKADKLLTYWPRKTSADESDETVKSTIVGGLFCLDELESDINTYFIRTKIIKKLGYPNTNKVILDYDHYDEGTLHRWLQLFNQQATIYMLHKKRKLELGGYEALTGWDITALNARHLTLFKRQLEPQEQSERARNEPDKILGQFEEEEEKEDHKEDARPLIPEDRIDVVTV